MTTDQPMTSRNRCSSATSAKIAAAIVANVFSVIARPPSLGIHNAEMCRGVAFGGARSRRLPGGGRRLLASEELRRGSHRLHGEAQARVPRALAAHGRPRLPKRQHRRFRPPAPKLREPQTSAQRPEADMADD